MVRIKFFSSFCSSEVCLQRYTHIYTDFIQNPSIEYTSDDNYTHAVIINTAMPSLACARTKTIGIAFEPICYLRLTPKFIDYATRNISVYYIGDNSNLPLPFTSHYAFMWHSPIPKIIPIKTMAMSIIYSQKKETFGQKYRHDLVTKILKLGLPIDIWGKGCSSNEKKDPRIKGEFSDTEPYEKYHFTIAIENCSLSHYVSEKFLNALIYETTPIYYGAKCVDWKFENQFIRLNGNIQQDMDLIADILKNPSKYKKFINSHLIAEKINIRNHFPKIF